MPGCWRPPGKSLTVDPALNVSTTAAPNVMDPLSSFEKITEQLTPTNVYKFTIGYLWWNCFWQTLLLFRQFRVLKNNPTMPYKLKRILDPVYYQRSRAYRLDRVRFALFQGILTHAYTVACIHFNVLNTLWDFASDVIAQQSFNWDQEIATSVVFISLLLIISGLLALPWDIYATFRIQIKHGISKQSVGCYLRESMKGLVINQLTTLPMACGLLYIVKRVGPMSFIYFWGARCLLGVLRETFYMTLIAPYFQKLYPLPNNRLRSAVESLSTSVGFPLKELYVFEVSQYTTISNAHIAGVFKGKSIILFDTLLKNEVVPYDDTPRSKAKPAAGSRVQFSRGPKDDSARTKTTYTRRRFPDEDVLAIVCHEIGHWKMSHIPKLFVMAELDNLINHLLVAYLYRMPLIFEAFGFTGAHPLIIGVVISAGLLITPYNNFMNFIRTWYKRHCEIQADQFVHRMQQGPFMEKAVITMNMDSLSFPLYDSLYNAWHNSHPPLPQRIEILRGDYTGASGLSTCHLHPEVQSGPASPTVASPTKLKHKTPENSSHEPTAITPSKVNGLEAAVPNAHEGKSPNAAKKNAHTNARAQQGGKEATKKR